MKGGVSRAVKDSLCLFTKGRSIGNGMSRFSFSQDSDKGTAWLVGCFKSAWRQTFPQEEDEVKAKHLKVKAQKHYTKEELQKIQDEMPEYLRGAVVSSGESKEGPKEAFKLNKLIPESLRKKVTESENYKEYLNFKENLKQYAATRDGVVANVGNMAYSTVVQGSNLARATEMMRVYDPSFSIFQVEKESTVIFKDAYHSFLEEKLSDLEKMASDQAYEYFSGHIKLNRTKKCKPKYTELLFNYPAQLTNAKIGEKAVPSFQFTIKVVELYCMIDVAGKIVDGDEQRIHQSVFTFSLTYAGNHVDLLGHPWQITEIRKLEEMKMLI